MSPRRPLGTVYLDEHIDPDVKDLCKDSGYRAIRIQESPYRGQDEREFIGVLRSQGAVFVTGDMEFVNEVLDAEIQHGGIWLIPTTLFKEERLVVAHMAIGFFWDVETRKLRDTVSYVAHDGLHLISNGIDELVYSFPQLNVDMEEFARELGGT